MMIYRYSIHGKLIFDVMIKNRFLGQSPYWLKRYEYFRIPYENKTPPGFTVEIGSFHPDKTNCIRLDEDYYIKEGYLFYSDRSLKLGGRLDFDVAGLDDLSLHIRIYANLQATPFIAGKVIDFFINYKLLGSGYSIVHASAVSLEGKGLLFSGRGGGGKTTFALTAVQEDGYNYLGDNFILCKDGELLCFPTDLNIFSYNIQSSIWNILSPLERFNFVIKKFIYVLSRGYIKIFTSVNPERILQKRVINKATLVNFMSLMTANSYVLNSTNRLKIIERTLSNHKLEFYPFIRHTNEYGYLFPNSVFSRHWEIYRDRLSANLPEHVLYFDVCVPKQLNSSIIKKTIQDCPLDIDKNKMKNQ